MQTASTVVTVLRAKTTGLGLDGTVREADDHAKVLLPMIAALTPFGFEWGFKNWIQGHQVHEFVTHEGTRYTLRGIKEPNIGDPTSYHYIGIRLSLRLSRSSEIRLLDVCSLKEIPQLATLMGRLARQMRGEPTPLMH